MLYACLPSIGFAAPLWYSMHMATTFERLRRLSTLRNRAPDPADDEAAGLHAVVERPRAPRHGRLEELIPGAVVANAHGTCYLSAHAYPLHTPRGAHPLGRLLDYTPAALAPFHPHFGLERAPSYATAAFLDTETTGLGTGAGVYCFMVGVGTFEAVDAQSPIGPVPTGLGGPPTHFVVRQFFMRNPGEEPALLAALAAALAGVDLAVTFNGRSFDLPLLRARYGYNRRLLAEGFAHLPIMAEAHPHLDLLMPARRLWKRRAESCRLANLEHVVLEHARTEDDVPGYLIPDLYLAYMRSGDAAEMRRVFYHNREDIVTMVALADRLSLAFSTDLASPAASTLPALDWWSLAHCYENQGRDEAALVAYRRALDLLAAHPSRAELFGRAGGILKRQGRWQEAAELWELWLTTVPDNDPTPYIELAKYCEWQLHDLAQAAMWTGWALHNLRNDRHRPARSPAITELEHRLARLSRKQQGMGDANDHVES